MILDDCLLPMGMERQSLESGQRLVAAMLHPDTLHALPATSQPNMKIAPQARKLLFHRCWATVVRPSGGQLRLRNGPQD